MKKKGYRRFAAFMAALAAAVCLTACGQNGGSTNLPPKKLPKFLDEPVSWTQPVIEQAVREKLQKPEGEIMRSEIAGITELDLSKKILYDIDDLALLTSLEELNLSDNHIHDISPLAELKELRVLDLSNSDQPYPEYEDNRFLKYGGRQNGLEMGNRPDDLSVLAGLLKLEELSIAGCSTIDLAPVAGLTSLKKLDVSRIPHLQPEYLSGLVSLEELSAARNDLQDISFLAGLTNLKKLDLSGNGLREITALAGLPALTSLNLGENDLSLEGWDLRPGLEQNLENTLRSFKNLKELYLGDPEDMHAGENSIRKLSWLEDLPQLETLSLSSMYVSDEEVRYVSSLPNLKKLFLSRNKLKDLSFLSSMTGLETLGLADCELTNVEGLQNLTNLKTLDLTCNPISDLSAIAGLNGLTELLLGEGGGIQLPQQVDLSPLAGLTELKTLHLNNFPCTDADIEALSGMTKLEDLKLSFTKVENTAGLSGLTSLKTLNLWGAPVADFSGLSGLKNLEKLNLRMCPADDLQPLAGLSNLKELVVWTAPEMNLQPLAGLEQLETLQLESESFSFRRSDRPMRNTLDLAPLSGLKNLKTLELEYLEIPDYTPLAGLTALENLKIEKMSLENLQPGMLPHSLKNLQIDRSDVQDLNWAADLGNLESFYVSLRNSEAAEVPLGLTNLRSLCLGGTPRSLTGVENLPQLQELFLMYPSLQDYSSVAKNAGLRHLEIIADSSSESAIRETLPSFAGMTSLRDLRLEGYENLDLSFLAGMKSLEMLDLPSQWVGDWFKVNRYEDISVLSQLTGLKDLSMVKNKISDLTALASLPNLRVLNLRGNEIADLTPLAGLTELRELDLSENKITEITPLSGLTKLTVLNLNTNQISSLAGVENLTELSGMWVDDNPLNSILQVQNNKKLQELKVASCAPQEEISQLWEAGMIW